MITLVRWKGDIPNNIQLRICDFSMKVEFEVESFIIYILNFNLNFEDKINRRS